MARAMDNDRTYVMLVVGGMLLLALMALAYAARAGYEVGKADALLDQLEKERQAPAVLVASLKTWLEGELHGRASTSRDDAG